MLPREISISSISCAKDVLRRTGVGESGLVPLGKFLLTWLLHPTEALYVFLNVFLPKFAFPRITWVDWRLILLLPQPKWGVHCWWDWWWQRIRGDTGTDQSFVDMNMYRVQQSWWSQLTLLQSVFHITNLNLSKFSSCYSQVHHENCWWFFTSWVSSQWSPLYWNLLDVVSPTWLLLFAQLYSRVLL